MARLVWSGTTVRVAGEIDLSNAEDVYQALVEAPPQIIDIADLTFIDSTGIRVLLWLHRDAACRIANPSPQLERILDLIAATDILLPSPN